MSCEHVLTLEDMQRMSIDDIIQKIRNGYNLSLHIDRELHKQQSLNNSLLNLGAPTCPSSLARGVSRTPSATLTTPGTPPYIYKFYVDGVLKHTSPSTSATTYNGYTHTFDESAGNHTYKYEVTDNCSPTPKTDYSQCIINITECPTPALSMTIPT